MVRLELEFGGGMELLFGNERQVEVDIPTPSSATPLTVRDALAWMRDNLLKERPELFMKENTIRPGVLVLVNDADWELSGMDESELEEGDKVTFISTLHGG
jgi:ubiquitin related modifier 1